MSIPGSGLLARAVDLRPGEFRRTAAIFALLSLVIASNYVLKPVRNSLFLLQFGAEQLPYVYILVAVALGLVASAFSNLVERYQLNRLLVGSAVIFGLNLVLFRWVFGLGWLYLSYVFYVWESIFSIVMPTLVWLLANYVFYPNEAKRLFSVVGAGGLLGSIAGSGLASLLARAAGTADLLLCGAAGVALSGALAAWIWRVERDRIGARLSDLNRRKARSVAEDTKGVLPLILRSRYLTLITAMTALIFTVSTVVDYQFNALAAESFQGLDALTGFFGTFFASLNGLAFLFQLLLGGRVLKHFGVGLSLLFLPAGLLAGSLGMLFLPGLATAILLKLADGGFRYSVNKSGLEILYLPLPLDLKNRTKPWIDMFVDRVSRGVGGLSILLATSLLSLSLSELSLMVSFLVLAWMAIALKLQQGYLNEFRLSLARRDIDSRALTAQIRDRESVSVLLQALETSDERQVLYALELLQGASDERVGREVARLVAHASAAVRAAALRCLRSLPRTAPLEQIAELAGQTDPAVRAETLALMIERGDPRGEQLLREIFRSTDLAGIGGALDSLEETPDRLAPLLNAQFVETLLASGEEDHRALAARVVGFRLHHPAGSVHLLELLRDPSTKVARAAAASAGKLLHPDFVPPLIGQLRERALRLSARLALSRYGERIVGPVSDILKSPAQDLKLRLALPRVLAEIESQKAVDLLLGILPQQDLRLDYQILKALGKMRARYPALRFARDEVERSLSAETRSYYQTAGALSALAHGRHLVGSHALLRRALNERLELNLERIFRLLGLLYPPRDIFNAWNGLMSGRVALRATALEFLDNLLRRKDKRALVPLLEESSPESAFARGRSLFGLGEPGFAEALGQLATGRDSWLAACAVSVARDFRLTGLGENEEGTSARPQWMVREAAQVALARPDRDQPAGDSDPVSQKEIAMYSLVEKVLFLQNVDLLSSTRSEDLALLSSIAQEVVYPEGSLIFKEEELADALYVILRGRVSLSKGGQQLVTVGEKEALGTWGLFEAEPRVMSARAAEESLLLKVDREDFYDLLLDYPELGQSILKALVRRLRKLIDRAGP